MSDNLADFKCTAIVNTLRTCRLFIGFPFRDFETIADVTLVKALEKGEYLFREGDPALRFYIVQRGAVNGHRVSAAGKEQIVYVCRAGDSFAEVAVAALTGYPADARALEPTQVLLV